MARTSTSTRKSLYLIDGHAQIYRLYYGPFGSLTAPSGEPTKATFGFAQMLLSLIKRKKPDYLAMMLDSGEAPNFRLAIDDKYKATRAPKPEDLPVQEERIIQILTEAGVPMLCLPGFEADDLIATAVERFKDRDVDIYLVSKDKDLDQLLSDKVRIYDPNKDAVIGQAELLQEKGYTPDKAVEVQALAGDAIDNVEGIPGVGPKTAARLVMKYGSAEAALAHADEQTPKLKENLKAFAWRVPVARRLVQLRRDVPLPFDLEDLRFRGLRKGRIRPIFEALGFARLLKQLEEAPTYAGQPGEQPAAEGAAARATEPAEPTPAITPRAGDLFSFIQVEREPGKYTLVDDEASFRDFAETLAKLPAFSIDTETTGISPIDADLVGLSFSWEPGTGCYVPVLSTAGKYLPARLVLSRLRPILEDPRVAKCGQNLKFDIIVLKQAGVELAGVAFDTMVASFLLDPQRPGHSLDRLAREILGAATTPITDLIGRGKKQIRMDQVDTWRVCQYSGEDADMAWRLRGVFGPQLERDGLVELFRQIEMPLVQVLAAMEHRGVKIDTRVLAEMGNQLDGRLADLAAQIQRHAGRSFNIDSTRQLAEVLFDEQDLPVIRRTQTGRSTDAAVLVKLAAGSDNPIPKLVLEYRELTKLKGTYVDTLPRMISTRTGRIHTSFNQTVAVTGRLSSSDPNLQNIPMRTELGRQIRRAFVPGEPGMVLLAGDYSQIELRVLAHFSKDPALVQAFREDRDIHAFVAGEVFGVPIDQVTSEQRGRAKTVNFGIIYGQGAQGLAQQTGMSVAEAKEFINRYFARYPRIRTFIDECVQHAEQHGYVRTMLGRRRPISEIRSRNPGLRAQAERLAINTVIQGSAADMMKKAMVDIHGRIVRDRKTWMLIQVHDELVFELPEGTVEQEAAAIRQQMAEALPLDVPVKADTAWGRNWLQAK